MFHSYHPSANAIPQAGDYRIITLLVLPMFVGVLGTGVPRLACLRPTAWLCERACTAHLHQQGIQDPREADAARPPWERPHQAGSRGAERSRRGTSRGACDASHDDRDQAGASTRSVLVSSLVLRRQAQARSTEASGKGCHFDATRPRPKG